LQAQEIKDLKLEIERLTKKDADMMKEAAYMKQEIKGM
jgi:hypothetical protein